MAVSNVTLRGDIVLDQNAFQVAADDLQNLSEDLVKLENRIHSLLDELSTGFDTPAGARFFAACNGKLLEPMQDQARVITHVSQNLRNVRQAYQSVFDEYQSLNSAIGSNRM
jgi:uncharacterized protein YukE